MRPPSRSRTKRIARAGVFCVGWAACLAVGCKQAPERETTRTSSASVAPSASPLDALGHAVPPGHAPASRVRRAPGALTPPVLGLDAQVLSGGVRVRVTNPLATKLDATAQVRAEVTFWKEDGTLVHTTWDDGAPATFPLSVVKNEGLREALRTLGPDSAAEVHLAASAWRPSGIPLGVPLLARVEKLVPVQSPPTTGATTRPSASKDAPAEHPPANAERAPSGARWSKQPSEPSGASAANAACATLLVSAWAFEAHAPKLTLSRVHEQGKVDDLPLGLGPIVRSLAVGEVATVWFSPGTAPKLTPNAQAPVTAVVELTSTECPRAVP